MFTITIYHLKHGVHREEYIKTIIISAIFAISTVD